MKNLTAILILFSVFCVLLYGANDPNEPVKPPEPNVEYITVVDSQTLRITTSVDIKRKKLEQQKTNLLRQGQEINRKLQIINERLAAFDR